MIVGRWHPHKNLDLCLEKKKGKAKIRMLFLRDIHTYHRPPPTSPTQLLCFVGALFRTGNNILHLQRSIDRVFFIYECRHKFSTTNKRCLVRSKTLKMPYRMFTSPPGKTYFRPADFRRTRHCKIHCPRLETQTKRHA